MTSQLASSSPIARGAGAGAGATRVIPGRYGVTPHVTSRQLTSLITPVDAEENTYGPGRYEATPSPRPPAPVANESPTTTATVRAVELGFFIKMSPNIVFV